MRTTTFKLPEDLDRTLSLLARERQTTRSAVVRQALEAFCRQGPLSAAALAGELVGSVEGPEDLSTSQRHMEDFGT